MISLHLVSQGYALIAVSGILIAEASLVEHGLEHARASVAVAPSLWSTGARA